MNRRDLIKDAARLAGSSALAKAVQPILGIASISTFALDATAQDESERKRRAPARPIGLSTAELKVTLDSKDGLPIYFVANIGNSGGSAQLTFPITGLQPELRDAVWGTMHDIQAIQSSDSTRFNLDFAPTQSFLLFSADPQ